MAVGDPELFAEYIKGHIPTLAKFGGRVVFRSIDNVAVHGAETRDAIALQEWPDAEFLERWWNSEEYRPWAAPIICLSPVIACFGAMVKSLCAGTVSLSGFF